jgi:hypothetical protein
MRELVFSSATAGSCHRSGTALRHNRYFWSVCPLNGALVVVLRDEFTQCNQRLAVNRASHGTKVAKDKEMRCTPCAVSEEIPST